MKGFYLHGVTIAIYLTTLFTSSHTVAQPNTKDLQDRLELVGVIAESNPELQSSGVAVIRDTKRNRSLTLRSGDRIAGIDQELTVISIRRNKVEIVSSEELRFSISHTGRSSQKDDTPHLAQDPQDFQQIYENYPWLRERRLIGNRAISTEELKALQALDRREQRVMLERLESGELRTRWLDVVENIDATREPDHWDDVLQEKDVFNENGTAHPAVVGRLSGESRVRFSDDYWDQPSHHETERTSYSGH